LKVSALWWWAPLVDAGLLLLVVAAEHVPHNISSMVQSKIHYPTPAREAEITNCVVGAVEAEKFTFSQSRAART
jgi:hypothetical protein